MPISERNRRGFTVLELLVVISIIALLMAVLIMALGKIRERTRNGQARNLLEKMHSAMENYYLFYRSYPPDNIGGRSGSQALNYFLTTAFRVIPDGSKGEIISSMDVGPLMSFDPIELDNPVTVGTKTVVDPWRSALVYRLLLRDFPDPRDPTLITKIPIPILYSCGTNKTDETILATTPNDDIIVGNQ